MSLKGYILTAYDYEWMNEAPLVFQELASDQRLVTGTSREF
jgi:hypothetical protein